MDDQAQQNKDLVLRMIRAVQEGGNLDKLDDFFAPTFVDHSTFSGFTPDRQGVRNIFQHFQDALSGLKVEVLSQVSEGSRVMTHKILYGMNNSPLFGIPASNKMIRINVMDMLQVQNGMITDHWNVVDQVSLMKQLGVLPA